MSGAGTDSTTLHAHCAATCLLCTACTALHCGACLHCTACMHALPACLHCLSACVQVARARKTARLDDSAGGESVDTELKRSEADEPITLSLAAAAAAKAAAAAADKQQLRPAAAAPPLFGDDEGETPLGGVFTLPGSARAGAVLW